MANGGGGLWDRAEIGEWGERSPSYLYSLFLRHQRPEGLGTDAKGRRRTEAYARLLMHVVAIQFNKHKWRRRLPQAGLVPEDVAQQAVMHLICKSATMRMDNVGWRPLLGVMNVSIRRYILQCVEGRRRKGGREVLATDYYRRTRADEDGRAAGGMAGVPAEIDAAAAASGDAELGEHLAAVRDALRGEDAADVVLGDLPTNTAAQASALEAAFSHMRDGLLGGEGVTPYWRLPAHVRTELTHEHHALVAARIRRLARRLGTRG